MIRHDHIHIKPSVAKAYHLGPQKRVELRKKIAMTANLLKAAGKQEGRA